VRRRTGGRGRVVARHRHAGWWRLSFAPGQVRVLRNRYRVDRALKKCDSDMTFVVYFSSAPSESGHPTLDSTKLRYFQSAARGTSGHALLTTR